LTTQIEQTFRELIRNKRKFIENLLVVEDKSRQLVPFIYNPIQADVDATQTGRDIWVKPSAVGFSTERIANRLVDTLTSPGTNTILIAYEDFITERLLSKVSFFYNHLASLNIPGFPEIHHDSTYEKTFRFYVNGRIYSTSSIYIASARSYVAGRAQTIHHLLADEFAFYPPGAIEDIIAPALARIPPDGTADIYSTPHGEDNEFCGMYQLAREGKSVFTAHFYPWYMHPEYTIQLGDFRIEMYLPETNKVEFNLSSDEELLQSNYGLTFDQIRWRRWKIKEMESLKRSGETRTLFPQEFPEDDISCFLSTGDMRFEPMLVDGIAKECYPAPEVNANGLHIWYKPEKGRKYIVSIDPGQAKITQSAITVVNFDQDELGNYKPKLCARDAGLYSPEVTSGKAIMASDYYNRAEIVWEANSHGLAITELLKHRRPIYFRKDIVNGMQSMEPGWLTSGGARGTKDYMLQTVDKYLMDLTCHDIELVRQLRNHRLVGDKVEVVGANDIFMSFAIGLCCLNPKSMKRGYLGKAGWRW
jgi:hypothetical protein